MNISRYVLVILCALVSGTTACGDAGTPMFAEPDPGPGGAAPPSLVKLGNFIYVASSTGVNPRELARGTDPDWSPDGRLVAFQGMGTDGVGGVFVIEVDGTTPTLMRRDAYWPRWSPDGSKIAFVTCIPRGLEHPSGTCDMTYAVMNANGWDGELALAQTSIHDGTAPPEWSPDGKSIAFVGGEECCPDVHVVRADGIGGAVRLTALGNVGAAAWSPDGRSLAVGAAGQVYVITADGSNLVQLTNDATARMAVEHVEWSPLGDRIAFSLGPDAALGGNVTALSQTINVVDANGTNQRQLASNAFLPRWLPEGYALQFSKWTVRETWLVSADGAGEPSLLIANGSSAQWSPDGRRIVYVRQYPNVR